MFGSKSNSSVGSSTGTKSVFGGVALTLIQALLTRRVAGRAAGIATRGAGGIPGLLLWIGISYLVNKYFDRNKQPAPTEQRNRELATR